MAITNPEAIAFSNTRIRPAADSLAKLYYRAKQVKQEWDANSMSSLITNTSDVIRDGASPTDDVGTGGDGRHVITGIDATAIITRLSEFITDYEASSNAKLNTVLAVAVNTNS